MQKVGDVYTLNIKQTTPQDAGTYKVVAKNSAGSGTNEINITITGEFYYCCRIFRVRSGL
jgi:hypothetical protein